jgi:predicted  nucleic acid-binding Zn-ribbon protein
MGTESTMENTIQEIHKAVIRIENDHGMKLEVLFDAVDSTNQRLGKLDQKVEGIDSKVESIDQRLTRVESRLDDTVEQMKGLNALVGLLQSIARDHEDRMVRLEN